jgi:hypothetical protein
METPADPPQPQIAALCRDLMFSSKITSAARAMGVPLKTINQPSALGNWPGRRLLVDLNLEGAIDAARAWRDATRGEVIGFVSHTDAATIEQARSAGLDRVMARGQFAQSLSGLLRL